MWNLQVIKIEVCIAPIDDCWASTADNFYIRQLFPSDRFCASSVAVHGFLCVCVCDNVIMSWHWYGETFQTFIFSIIRPWTMTQHTYDNPITRTRIPRRTSVNSLRSINGTRQPTTADMLWHISLQIMYYYLLRPWNVVPDIFQSNEFYCYTAAYIHRVQSPWCSCASSSSSSI